ncbi:hypothetical protein [Rhizobium leguminosarum]|jgi:hypothetical protein|uniref:hypothetical protein n=1 Tax=Rhizobium leguminosarum TaxID=384 RepID=UPI000B92838F|nr:hypothetical protein [Rhizobium leguminosarum]ASS57589.1 hypothetical protein CHR56_25225 [Rhizobium leguminosarum bv. viciae]MBY5465276.1 hypothetical protein [Rhizobium leguminosarum]TBZ84227.1 hypothetical protein E0H53_22240 [Rhizobium leguminosarum bv. viciae]TCA05020.1 hypothetical protein E0H63_14040 [Rhizobium leguminosarum bv. viciae]TCA52843.1 hypothetical protein E0H71_16380 [Rhizobium leguminosarum bv. viciae]
MARYNKIYGGPAEEVKPQVHEAICATSVLPGTAVVRTAGAFVAAVAASKGRMFVVQDNYLAMKGVDDAWPAGDRIIGMELLDEQLFRVRVPTGTSITQDAALTVNAAGKFIPAVAGNHVVAFANETYNNTSGADQLVSVRAAKGYTFA